MWILLIISKQISTHLNTFERFQWDVAWLRHCSVIYYFDKCYRSVKRTLEANGLIIQAKSLFLVISNWENSLLHSSVSEFVGSRFFVFNVPRDKILFCLTMYTNYYNDLGTGERFILKWYLMDFFVNSCSKLRIRHYTNF